MVLIDEDMDRLGDGETVVTPTRRLAHYLKERWNDRCAKQGLTVWRTPDIVTWDGLIERAVARDRQRGRLQGRWLGARAAQIKWDRIVRSDAELPGVASLEGIASRAYLSWRRLNEYLIPVAALDEPATPESRAFSRWVRRYTRWLAAGQWIESSGAARQVSAEALGPHLHLTGFEVLTPAQRAFLERIAAAGVCIEQSAGAQRSGRRARVSCADFAAEIDTAARWAASRLQREPELRLAIVVPELRSEREAVRRSLARVLAPASTLVGGPQEPADLFELASAAPLLRAPLVLAALDLLGAMIEPGSEAAVDAVLRNPFLRGADAEASARACLDAWRRSHRSGTFDLRDLCRQAGLRRCPELALALNAGFSEMESWPEVAAVSHWAENFFKLLSVSGWPGRQLDGREYQAQQRWQELLAEFGSVEEVVGRLPAREALKLLRQMTAQVLFEPEQSRGPLLVIDPETCAGMQFDGLWLCGLDASRWPPAAQPDPFLPLNWQAQCEVPGSTAQACLEEAQRLLGRLARSADEVIVSVPMQNNGASLQPSPLVADWPVEEPGADWTVASVTAEIFGCRESLQCLDDSLMPEITTAKAAGGARALELQAACGFRAQAELRLGARPLEEPAPWLDARTRGALVHQALEDLWRQIGDSASLSCLSHNALVDILDGVIERRLSVALHDADAVTRQLLAIEAGWLTERILELLEIDRRREPFSIADLEERAPVRIGGLDLALRPDRIDRLADGSLAVIDYKTGGTAETAAWFDERPGQPQLPLYVAAAGAEDVSAVAFARLRAGQTGYQGIARAPGVFDELECFGRKGRTKAFDDWPTMLSVWRQRLEALAREHREGDARLALIPAKACVYCSLSSLCRKSELTERIEADLDD